MYLLTTVITAMLAISVQAISVPSSSPLLVNAITVSPDGYRYIIDARPFITQVSTQWSQMPDQVPPHAQLVNLKPDLLGSYGSVKRTTWIESSVDQDTCGPSSFNSMTSNASPLVADCASLRDLYRARRGWWEAAAIPDFVFRHRGDWMRLASMGSCTFGLKPPGSTLCGIKVGNTDIADLIGDAIDRFQADGRVGAEGEMTCTPLDCTGKQTVLWAIFHA